MEKHVVLVVDDTPDNINVLSSVLSDDYSIKVATNGPKAIDIAKSEPQPDLILLDVMMPVMDGYEVCELLKKDPKTNHIPVIFVTAKVNAEDETKGFNLGAVDYITKPISPPVVKSRVKTHLALYDQNKTLEQKVKTRTEELEETRLAIIHKLGRAAEFKDNETGMHVMRMSHFSRLLADSISDNKVWVNLVFHAAPMHDIGKIGIPDHILLKPGKLSDEEWTEMQRHAEYGGDIIGENDSDILLMAQQVAYTHHEKWDGSGYPKGLAGEEIPLPSRIVAVADVFDALTSVRPYKEAWSVEAAVEFIKNESGRHFDPELIPHFVQLIPLFEKIMKEYEDKT